MTLTIPESSLIEFGKFCANNFSSDQLCDFLQSKGITVACIPEIVLPTKLKYKVRIYQLTDNYSEYMISSHRWLKRSCIGKWAQSDLENETLFDNKILALNIALDAGLVILEKNNL